MYNYTKLETDNKYYKIFIHKDLFGNRILTRSWGSKVNKRSNFKHDVFENEASLNRQLKRLIARRLSHNYQLVGS